MFDPETENTILELALRLECAAAVDSDENLSNAPEDAILKRLEQSNLGIIVSHVLIGFLCASPETKTAIYLTGVTGGILPEFLVTRAMRLNG